ncbi:MAG: DsbC family protein, partial [Armatimonadetes bacterium]|nr:DsbC family protein [Armatimonadota bacterium]
MKKIVSERDDVAFYLKMFPLVQLHKEAHAKSRTILCALKKDNGQALKLLEDVYARKNIPAPSCETTAVDESIREGQRIGVRSTPAMV